MLYQDLLTKAWHLSKRPDLPADDIIEGATEAELAVNELVLMRSLFGTTASTEQTRDNNCRFVSKEQADADAAEATRVAAIDPAAEAAIVERALANRGIKLDILQKFQAAEIQNSWAKDGEQWRTSTASWSEGDANARKLG